MHYQRVCRTWAECLGHGSSRAVWIQIFHPIGRKVITVSYQLRVTAALCVAMLSSSACAGLISLPTTLDVLLPDGDFAMVGNYKFDEFTYNASGDMPIAEQIEVSALRGGIRFTGGGANVGACDDLQGRSCAA